MAKSLVACAAYLWMPTTFAMQTLVDQDAIGQARVSAPWTKIYQIMDGSIDLLGTTSFPLTSGASGDITSDVGSSHAKLSDSDINAMASSRDGYSHVYEVKSSDCPRYLYVKTNDAYSDIHRSFGATKPNTLVGLGSSYETVSRWATLPSTLHGIDLLYTTPKLGGETCCRYLFGHGRTDCWADSGKGKRCIHGGSNCSSYKKLEGVVVQLYTGAELSPAPARQAEEERKATQEAHEEELARRAEAARRAAQKTQVEEEARRAAEERTAIQKAREEEKATRAEEDRKAIQEARAKNQAMPAEDLRKAIQNAREEEARRADAERDAIQKAEEAKRAEERKAIQKAHEEEARRAEAEREAIQKTEDARRAEEDRETTQKAGEEEEARRAEAEREAIQKAEGARRAEEERKAIQNTHEEEEARRAEAEREAIQKAEEARRAEEDREAIQKAHEAEEAMRAEKERKAHEEEAERADEERKAIQKAEEARRAEEERNSIQKAHEEEEARRAEEDNTAIQKAEEARRAEEEGKAIAEAAEAMRAKEEREAIQKAHEELEAWLAEAERKVIQKAEEARRAEEERNSTQQAPGRAEAPRSAVAAAKGDPHLQNVFGERFDVMRPGRHVLIQIPQGAGVQSTLLRVEADARQMGLPCAPDVYFEDLNITGASVDAKWTGGLHFHAEDAHGETPHWEQFGEIELKVVHGRTQKGIQYLNLYVKHLKRAGFAVGGLLGLDDHTEAETPLEACARRRLDLSSDMTAALT